MSLTTPLPAPDLGVGVAFNFPPSQDCEFLGVLTNLSPSNIFSTSWPWIPGTAERQVVQLHLTIENAQALLEKLNAKPPVDVRQELARKTALNLFRFIESYGTAGSQALGTDPSTVLDKWFQRFQEKYRLDPNFMLRTD